MKMKYAFLLLVLIACAPVQEVKFENLDPHRVNELLEKKDEMGLFVLNVHTPYEGKLDKTDATIEDWENIAAHVDQLPKDKNTPILVYCRTGRMSTSAVEQLKTLGYTNLYHLNGGMKAWDSAGFEVIDKAWK